MKGHLTKVAQEVARWIGTEQYLKARPHPSRARILAQLKKAVEEQLEYQKIRARR